MAEERKPAAPAKVVKVLQVEDAETDAELAMHELQRCGLSCMSSRVCTEADFIDAVTAFGPDVILSDLTMPLFDGLRALEIARQLAPAIPFVFLSGSRRPVDIAQALAAGASGYLDKNDMTRLGSVVKAALHVPV